jgi:hypothetical protein
VSAPHATSTESFPLFLPFPQRSLILHSFCTSKHQFPVAHDSEYAHSAHSASVSCIEPARDCCRAGGDRWFSRVNHREGFQKCASAHSRELGRCGLLRESFPKKVDWRRPLTQLPQAKVCESRIRGWIAHRVSQQTCALSGVWFPEFTICRLMRRNLLASHSRAMRPRWLAWAAFILNSFLATDFRGFTRIEANLPSIPLATIIALDNSLFVLLYWRCTYATEKNRFVPSFPKILRAVHKRRKASIAF